VTGVPEKGIFRSVTVTVYNKQLPNCLKRVKTSVVPIAFDGVLCEVLAYTVAFFLYLGIK
jgi:hypothetical protein